MRRTPKLAAAVVAASMIFASCKDSATSDLPIPKDAALVLHVNTSSLSSKLSWDEIKATAWFKELSTKADDSLAKQLLDNPENSGIDTKGGLAFFVKKQGKGGYMVFEGKIKDAAAFEAAIKQMHKDAEIKKDGDLKYMAAEDHSMVSWTSSKFIAVADAPDFANMNMMGGSRGTAFPIDSLKKFTKDLLALKSSDALDSDDRFSKLLKEEGDMHFWMNYDAAIGSMGNYLSMLKAGSLLKGNAATYTLNFDDGKIAVKSTVYVNNEIAKLMAKFDERKVSADLVNRIPSENVVGVIAANFDPRVFKEVFTAAGVDGLINGALSEVNLSLDELVDASNGQFLVAVSDLQSKQVEKLIPAYFDGMEPTRYTTTERDMNVLFATSVKNKATFDKLANMMDEMTKKGSADTSKMSYKITNDWFVASNKGAVTDKFLAGGTPKQAFTDKIAGHPFGMYIDLQKAIKSGAPKLSNVEDSAIYEASIKMWENIVATGGEFKNNSYTAEFVVNLVDKSKNSLKQLNEYGNKLYEASQLRRRSYAVEDSELSSDQTMVAPVEERKSN